ncbi:MAG: cupin domain-containing protein [Anaerolineae bacterium]
MNSPSLASPEKTRALLVPVGEDRYGEFKVLGISSIAVKVSKRESSDLFAVEITLQQKGGPAKHLHYDQDEWFYALEGDLLIEAGDERFRMKPGDALFVKKAVPHVWANVGETRMRFLALVTPAGKLEEFFENAAKNNAPPGPDQKLWRPYGMEWVGPPMKID